MDETAEMAAVPAAAPAAVAFVGGRSRSTVVALDYPITWNGQEIDGVTVTRLTGQQIADLPEKCSGDEVFGQMSSVPMSVVMQLDAEDSARVMGVLQDFLPQGMKMAAAQTGESGTSTPPLSPQS